MDLQQVFDWGLGTAKVLEKMENFRNTSNVTAATCSPLFLLFRETFGWWFSARE
jgi:hypothetical protein